MESTFYQFGKGKCSLLSNQVHFRYARGDGSPQVELENEELENSGCGSNGDLKRKTADGYEPQHPNKSQKSIQGDERSSPHNNRTPHKQPKREKLDWNVLMPPKSRSKGK